MAGVYSATWTTIRPPVYSAVDGSREAAALRDARQLHQTIVPDKSFLTMTADHHPMTSMASKEFREVFPQDRDPDGEQSTRNEVIQDSNGIGGEEQQVQKAVDPGDYQNRAQNEGNYLPHQDAPPR